MKSLFIAPAILASSVFALPADWYFCLTAEICANPNFRCCEATSDQYTPVHLCGDPSIATVPAVSKDGKPNIEKGWNFSCDGIK